MSNTLFSKNYTGFRAYIYGFAKLSTPTAEHYCNMVIDFYNIIQRLYNRAMDDVQKVNNCIKRDTTTTDFYILTTASDYSTLQNCWPTTKKMIPEYQKLNLLGARLQADHSTLQYYISIQRGHAVA
jgi:hypothetical protein